MVFDRKASVRGEKLDLPCGQCIGCRLERSRQWAVRCVHEATLYEENTFITLTYNDENLPENKSINVVHFQLFMKRLRKKFSDRTIRFFHCGEYGKKKSRPHYHAILFNFEFTDLKFKAMGKFDKLYSSEVLDKLWGMGECYIGDVTFESAAYVARYLMKKVTNKKCRTDYRGRLHVCAKEHYGSRKAEYITMSRRPGIGKKFYEKYSKSIYPSDNVVIRGREMRPPKFYDSLLEKTDPDLLEKLKKIRIKKGVNYTWQNWKGNKFKASDNDLDRLIVKEAVKIAQTSTLKRNL